jgi:hypothetical protein
MGRGMRRLVLVLVPAILLAGSPAFANHRRAGRPNHRLQSAGQVVTHGGTSPTANLARARAARVRSLQQMRSEPPRGRPVSNEELLREHLRARQVPPNGIDRRSAAALFLGVPVIAGWIYVVSQYGHAILNVLAP